MKRISILLALLAAGWCDAHAAPASTNSAAAGRVLMIDSSSMPVAAGSATLIIGPLQRTNGVYSGDYKIKVFPYFLKNEKGRLAIVISDKALAEAGQGKVVTITGTATTSGKNGRTRPIDSHRHAGERRSRNAQAVVHGGNPENDSSSRPTTLPGTRRHRSWRRRLKTNFEFIMKRITVLLAEDHMIVREGFRKMLELEDDIEIVGEAQDGRQAVALAKKFHPDVVLMDIAMPLLNGLEATRQVLKAFPPPRCSCSPRTAMTRM